MKETLCIQPNGTEDDQDLERSFLLPERGDDMFFLHTLEGWLPKKSSEKLRFEAAKAG